MPAVRRAWQPCSPDNEMRKWLSTERKFELRGNREGGQIVVGLSVVSGGVKLRTQRNLSSPASGRASLCPLGGTINPQVILTERLWYSQEGTPQDTVQPLAAIAASLYALRPCACGSLIAASRYALGADGRCAPGRLHLLLPR